MTQLTLHLYMKAYRKSTLIFREIIFFQSLTNEDNSNNKYTVFIIC